MALFGPANTSVSPDTIRNFLANPNLTADQIFDQAQASNVSLDQIRGAVPNDPRFAASNPNLLPFIASKGVSLPVTSQFNSLLANRNVSTPDLSPDVTGAHILNLIPTDTRLPTEDLSQVPLNGGEIPTGLRGSELAQQGGLEAALAALLQGLDSSRSAIGSGRDTVRGNTASGIQNLSNFSNAGDRAIDVMAALSGSLGPEAQASAISAFMDSPGQDFLRERGEQAITRNTSAIGGLGGGNVRKELQRFGTGVAAQDFNDNFGRLATIADAGLGAIGQGNSLLGQESALAAALSGQLSGQEFGGGQIAANLGFNTGQSLAAGRTRAGEQIASNINNTTSALTQLINQQGTGLSNLTGATSGNLASVLSGMGQAQELTQQQLAALLSNLASQEGTNLTQVKPLQGIVGPVLDATGKVASAIGAGFA